MTLARITEMVEAAQAREGANSPTEKAALWAALFLNIIGAPLPRFYKLVLTEEMEDIIRAYHPGEEAKTFLDNAFNPAMAAMKKDVQDILDSRG